MKKLWFGDIPHLDVEEIDPKNLNNEDIFYCLGEKIVAICLDRRDMESPFSLVPDVSECCIKNGAPCFFNCKYKENIDSISCIYIKEDNIEEIEKSFIFIEKSLMDKMKQEGIWEKC